MPPRPTLPGNRTVTIALSLFTIAFALAILAAATAQASEYEVRACSGGVDAPPYTLATNTVSSQHPKTGIFAFADYCDRSAGDVPGNSPFMRIAEDQPSGNAPFGAYLAVDFTAPPGVRLLRAGGYTREPYAFNGGWEAHFKFTDPDGVTELQMAEGAGLQGAGFPYFERSPSFTPHLWPWPYGIQLDRWAFDLICVNYASGCDTANYNVADLSRLVFTLEDLQDSQVTLADAGSDLLAGRWVSGPRRVAWTSFDNGSGLRFERLRVDGAERHTVDYRAIGACHTDPTGLAAATFQPCPTGGPNPRAYQLDTASLSDGAHQLSVCAQDFGQYQGLNGTGSETCETRTIRTDNHAPAAPTGLRILTPDRDRYRSRFGARFALPTDSGSPIVEAHYQVVDASGHPVAPERALSGTPTKIPAISAPERPGAYRLRVWLQDAAGHVGRVAEADVPHDATPPAAPQGLTVTPPATSRAADGFDLRWRDITDAGAPIDAAHYQVLDAAGRVVVPTTTVRGRRISSIADLRTPAGPGSYALRLWLSDAEGNAGAPVTAPLAYRCVRSAVPGGARLGASLGGRPARAARQGRGATLAGSLRAASGAPVGGAALCVFSRVLTDPGARFLGIALTDAAGSYRFALAPGPSRRLSVLYRPGHRRLRAAATLRTVVRPTLRARRRVVVNGHWAHLHGRIPGPHNDGVVVVLQVRQGEGWLAFRRYRARGGGRYRAAYHFRRTTRPTTYLMRAQVRKTTGYPYLQGQSKPLRLRVVPARRRGR